MNAEDEPMTTEDEQKNGTKRKSPDDKSDVPVRKSSRIRLRTDLRKHGRLKKHFEPLKQIFSDGEPR